MFRKLLSIAVFTGCFYMPSFGQTSGLKIENSEPVINPFLGTTTVTINGTNVSGIYKTEEIIRFNYLNHEADSVAKVIKATLSDLYKNSIDSNASRYSQVHREKKYLATNKNQKRLIQIRKEQDSLYQIYTKDYLQYDRFLLFEFNAKRSMAMFDILYGNSYKRFRTLNNTGFNFNSTTGSIYSELASGDLGVFRVGFGTMLTTNSSDDDEAKQDEAFQRLATYGGNTVLNLEYPLLYAHSRNNQYNLIGRLIGKGAADMPQFGTKTDAFAGNMSCGIDIYGDASTSNNAIRFFFNTGVTYYSGNEVFKENLGTENAAFYYSQSTVGFVVNNSIKISLVVHSWSPEAILQNKNTIIGGQVLK